MVNDFKEILEVKIVASSNPTLKFKVQQVKIDLTFDEEIERSSFLCDNSTAFNVIEGFAPTDDVAKKAVCLLMKHGKVSLVEEY